MVRINNPRVLLTFRFQLQMEFRLTVLVQRNNRIISKVVLFNVVYCYRGTNAFCWHVDSARLVFRRRLAKIEPFICFVKFNNLWEKKIFILTLLIFNFFSDEYFISLRQLWVHIQSNIRFLSNAQSVSNA
jgi:hypothetical protein